jgi:hypothetical protein
MDEDDDDGEVSACCVVTIEWTVTQHCKCHAVTLSIFASHRQTNP